MIRIVDRSNSHVVQKVLTPKGETVAYQFAPLNGLGDTSKVTRVSTLSAARAKLESAKLAEIAFIAKPAVQASA